MSENPFAYDNYDQAELPVLMSDSSHSRPVSQPGPSPSPKEKAGKFSKLEQLKAREAELLRRQNEIKAQIDDVFLRPNWPQSYPVIRYDVENDIPQTGRDTVKYAFYGLISIACSCLFNVIAVLSVSGLKSYNKSSAFVFAIIQGLATLYVGFNFSYSGIYEACRKRDIPFKTIIIQFCFIGWSGYRLIGFPSSGCVGIAVLLDLLANDSSGLSKLCAFVNSALSGATLYFELKTLMEAQKFQKVSGKNDESPLNPTPAL